MLVTFVSSVYANLITFFPLFIYLFFLIVLISSLVNVDWKFYQKYVTLGLFYDGALDVVFCCNFHLLEDNCKSEVNVYAADCIVGSMLFMM